MLIHGRGTRTRVFLLLLAKKYKRRAVATQTATAQQMVTRSDGTGQRGDLGEFQLPQDMPFLSPAPLAPSGLPHGRK